MHRHEIKVRFNLTPFLITLEFRFIFPLLKKGWQLPSWLAFASLLVELSYFSVFGNYIGIRVFLKMPTKGSTPYGVKTLLECMARAALLAQPEDISTFLTLYLKNMFRSRTEDGKDIKVVAFDYEEDWGEYQCQISVWRFPPGTLAFPSQSKDMQLTCDSKLLIQMNLKWWKMLVRWRSRG